MSKLEQIIRSPNRPHYRLDDVRLGEPWPDSTIYCRDGFRLSVCTGSGMYCTPRNDQGPYEDVEVGFPSERPEPWASTLTDDRERHWRTYSQTESDPTGTIYAYVPVSMVRALVELHGGEAQP